MQAPVGDLLAQHFHGVVARQAHVAKPQLLDEQQAVADARFVDLDPEEVLLWFLRWGPRLRIWWS